MKHLLCVGQVFRCSKFIDLTCTLDGHEVNYSELRLGQASAQKVVWTEREGDWQRTRETTFDLSTSGMDKVNFRVIEVAPKGGYINTHRPNESWPAGHWVRAVATTLSGDRHVEFYQTMEYVGAVLPEDIQLISGPPDVLREWVVRAEFKEVP